MSLFQFKAFCREGQSGSPVIIFRISFDPQQGIVEGLNYYSKAKRSARL
jgi:hypothetical protein